MAGDGPLDLANRAFDPGILVLHEPPPVPEFRQASSPLVVKSTPTVNLSATLIQKIWSQRPSVSRSTRTSSGRIRVHKSSISVANSFPQRLQIADTILL